MTKHRTAEAREKKQKFVDVFSCSPEHPTLDTSRAGRLYLQRTPHPGWKADIISETHMLWEPEETLTVTRRGKV